MRGRSLNLKTPMYVVLDNILTRMELHRSLQETTILKASSSLKKLCLEVLDRHLGTAPPLTVFKGKIVRASYT